METIKKKKLYKNPRCPHDKIKAVCKDCNGCAICVHGRRKTICKECGGGSLCEHGREKIKCKLCGGNSVCEHKRIKLECKECKGSAICAHNRIKYNCKQCGGKSFCEHEKNKTLCKKCKGSAICCHDKRKVYCKLCGGSALCEHKKRKSQCMECGGGPKLCQHKKQKSYCKICGGTSLCKSTWCETKGNKKYNGYCLPCCIQVCPEIKVARNYKTKEKDVVDRIKEVFPNLTWISDKKIQDGCSSRRPDLLVDLGTHILIMEVDENKHTDYDCSCENKRLMELSKDVGHRPIVFIRFNPDSYTDITGKNIKSCWKLNKLGVMQITKTKEKEWNERIQQLIQQIRYWIDNPTEKTVEIVELFY
jgi:hypothetical protein